MGSKVTNAHLQRSVHARHTHTAMQAARGSVFFLSTTCAVRSGACMGSPDSQFMLLTSKVKCNTCFGTGQFMSQKPFTSDSQEEQKARYEMLITAVAVALLCELYPHGLELQKYQGVPCTARCPITVPVWYSTTDTIKDMGKCPSTYWKPCWEMRM